MPRVSASALMIPRRQMVHPGAQGHADERMELTHAFRQSSGQ